MVVEKVRNSISYVSFHGSLNLTDVPIHNQYNVVRNNAAVRTRVLDLELLDS